MQINQTLIDYMRTGGGPSYASEVVVRERGKTYLRYDGVRIGNAGDGSGGVSMQFLWQGAAIAWVRLYEAKLEGGVRMHSVAISGRLDITTGV